MPMLDMTLTQLKEYQGINPKPHDFDEFWDNGIKEMKSVDPKISITKSKEFQVDFADCLDLYFTGTGGARVYAKYLKPKNIKDKAPAVLQFHGYTGNSGEWANKLSYVAAGYSVFALDCRGQGGKSEDLGGVRGTTLNGDIIRGLDDSPEKLLYRNIFLDAAMLANIAMNMEGVDPDRIGAMGTSQGGGLTIACAALEPRIKRAVSVIPFLSDYKRVWEMDLDKDAYYELQYYFRHFDPAHRREDEIFTRLGYIDVQHLAKRIKADTMMCCGLLDNICPPSTQFAAYNKMTCNKQIKIYPDFKHEVPAEFLDQSFEFMMKL